MKTIKLYKPIGELNELTVRFLTHAEHKAALKNKDEFDQIDELIIAATGIDKAQIEQLSTVDFNELEHRVLEQVEYPSSYFLSDEIKPDNPRLLVPIGDVDEVELSTPTVKHSRMMQKIKTDKDPDAQAQWLTKACTGLDDAQIDQLSLPDWNQIQRRLNDFLNQASDFFR